MGGKGFGRCSLVGFNVCPPTAGQSGGGLGGSKCKKVLGVRKVKMSCLGQRLPLGLLSWFLFFFSIYFAKGFEVTCKLLSERTYKSLYLLYGA
ncbi:hypothetical protein GGTG_11928 [Gaeumannomyces tritici R3-111a-1]|uniref:Uncharacterized protein n=1 Tax=Gaeumannomyces tritici (strain R3-111a-1) TaxID=644352 RepID=J3PEJ7_GAET3|nr:hypothetical protein GGTG_11928 [Gaeumannomyces tritici R3-111a-1]EJT70905.1 hypothetical protein GGTG_11928 [Gaeumannomyces tritici R3-111a-1]